MKDKCAVFALSLLIFLFVSCNKEASRSPIVGQWRSVAVYTVDDSGAWNWMPIEGWHEYYSFSADGKFGYSTDCPGRLGTYTYNNRLHRLVLRADGNPYGSAPSTETLQVELLTNKKLILSDSPVGFPGKTEFERIK